MCVCGGSGQETSLILTSSSDPNPNPNYKSNHNLTLTLNPNHDLNLTMILTLNPNPNNYNPAQRYVAAELHNNCMTRSLQKTLQNTIIQKELSIQLGMICMGSSTSNALSGLLTVRVPIHDKNLY